MLVHAANITCRKGCSRATALGIPRSYGRQSHPQACPRLTSHLLRFRNYVFYCWQHAHTCTYYSYFAGTGCLAARLDVRCMLVYYFFVTLCLLLAPSTCRYVWATTSYESVMWLGDGYIYGLSILYSLAYLPLTPLSHAMDNYFPDPTSQPYFRESAGAHSLTSVAPDLGFSPELAPCPSASTSIMTETPMTQYPDDRSYSFSQPLQFMQEAAANRDYGSFMLPSSSNPQLSGLKQRVSKVLMFRLIRSG